MNAFSSGLGLYLCKKICSQLDHKLTFTSEHQKGTCFTLQLKVISKNLQNCKVFSFYEVCFVSLYRYNEEKSRVGEMNATSTAY